MGHHQAVLNALLAAAPAAEELDVGNERILEGPRAGVKSRLHAVEKPALALHDSPGALVEANPSQRRPVRVQGNRRGGMRAKAAANQQCCEQHAGR